MTRVLIDDIFLACPVCGLEGCEEEHTPLLIAHHVYRRWLGPSYDLGALNAVLAAAVVEQLKGDPLWLLVVSGPGFTKTETVQALSGAGAHVTSTITSEGALLSATPAKEKAKDATGGLLRRLGERGILVVKDVTSVLAMNRDMRAQVLAALREIHDGKWERNVGTNGGKTLTWTGRLAIVGAVTTAWDHHHRVVATMGDRFVLLRMDSKAAQGRRDAGQRAIANTGREEAMRADLAAAARAVIAAADLTLADTVTEADQAAILHAADLTTLCRTAVEFDYRGDVVDAHAPEAPTRFAKQLTQLLRGGLAMGLPHDDALALALRCARDSIPPLRLAILEDLAVHPRSRTHDVRRRLDKPRNTVDRQLQALHILEALTCDELEDDQRHRSSWYYSVADRIDVGVLRLPNPAGHSQTEEPCP